MNRHRSLLPRSDSTTRRRTWTRRTAFVAGLLLVPELLVPVASAEGTAAALGRPTLPAHQADKVSPLTAKVDKKTEAEMRKAAAETRAAIARAATDQAKKPIWPQVGKATLTVPVSGTASARAGSLPVTLSPPAATPKSKKNRASGSLTVEVLSRAETSRLGVKGLVVKVTGPAAGGSAALGVDYSGFASAYGGDWAGRLEASRLPDCALSTPAAAKCRALTPLTYANDRADHQLTAQLDFQPSTAGRQSQAVTAASGPTMLMALAAGGASARGDYKATPLSASSSWEAGGSSGSFTWSYPFRTPPAAAGPSPSLSISYDSGSVDGRTASTNNQGTAVGEGFDLTSSYVERKYGSCDDDGQSDKFDLCWKYENASLVLNGKATELVKDDTSGGWRLKNDDASTVTHSVGADNGDDGGTLDKGEYWTVTTGEGTKYVFGLNKLDGAAAADRTNSVWTAPVFGDDAGEPGFTSGDTFAERGKKQAWRWNLDYVEDTHGNAMSYWYEAESNNYDQLGDDNTGTSYTRGGYLKEIRYGQRKGALFTTTATAPAASGKVVLGYDKRCVRELGSSCAELTEDSKDEWPDVPFDAICKDGDKCTGNVGPAFFTRKRLTTVTTYAWNAAAATPAFEPVDEWKLKQTYLDPGDTGDSADQSLWLQEIRHTGRHGTALTLDPVTFTHEFLSNRVDGTTDDILPFHKPRLKTVTSESGAQTIVSYLPEDCVAGQTMPAVDKNTRRCYPVRWAPNGGKTTILDWFHKYPVQAVSTTAPKGGLEAVEHTYAYGPSGGAWHYADDPLTKEKDRTWSSWRGYDQVTHVVGKAGGTQSKTVTYYLRGMNGDRVLGADGTLDPDGRKTVSVTGLKAAAFTDQEQFAGFTRESVVYNGATAITSTVNTPWSRRTATQHKSYADTEAYFVRTAATTTHTYITSGGTPSWRTRTVNTTFDDTYGVPVTVSDRGDDSKLGDETCTRTWYARNNAAGLNNLASRTRVVANTETNPVTDPCTIKEADLDLPADFGRPGQIISDTATSYDTASEWSATQTPTVGEVRWTGRAKGYTNDDQPQWQKTATLTYDTLGRTATTADTNGLITTTTTYDPPASGPLTSTTVKNTLQHGTTTLVDFATGSPTKVTDPNGKITETEYDALGRLTKVWLPNQLKALNRSPNQVYTYSVTNAAMPWVSTATIKGDGSGYNTSYVLYDSLLRPRQTQTPSPAGGTVIAQTLYDSRGLTVSAQADIWANNLQPSGTPVEIDGGQPPVQTDTTYDGAGRAVKTVTKTRNVARWTTETAYLGDTVTTTAPAGGQATAVISNTLGQTTERREYGGAQPTGSDYTTTNYTYTPAGKQATITGPDKATWSYAYDLFGRQTSSTDPDKGTSTSVYNELDQMVSATDVGRGKTLVNAYDGLGRKTGLWDGIKDQDHQLAAWEYDKLLKGQQDTAIRYDGGSGTTGKAYTRKVNKRDNLYQVTDSSLVLPDGDALVTAGVPKTLTSTAVYLLDGSVKQASNPAVAGLAAETVSYKYNPISGLQTEATGATGYQLGATYDPLGDLTQAVLGTDGTSSAKKAYLNYSYEAGTRRLTRSYVTTDAHSYPLQDLNFTQDDAGNVTSILDTTTLGGTAKADNQCFTYDGHSRLTEAWTPRTADCATAGRTTANIDGAAPYWTSYTYTQGGQRNTETQHTSTGDQSTTYTYNDITDAKPHTLDKTTGARAASYIYDAAGNTIARPGPTSQQTLTWNSEGELAKLTEKSKETGYLYDADGELLIRRAKADGDTVLYLGGTEVRLTVTGTVKTLTGTRYYTAAGQNIAVRTATSGVSGTKLTFLAADHHGTSNIAIEANTYTLTKRYTTPFGAPRGTTTNWPDDKAFLGKPADESTALTHIGAREYDPAIGQFISVDPVLDPSQHQSLNGYAYANNTPVTSSDPTGLWIDDGTGHSEPNPGGAGGPTSPTPGVPSGGKGRPACYYYNSCGQSHSGGGTASTGSGSSSSGSSTCIPMTYCGRAPLGPAVGPKSTFTPYLPPGVAHPDYLQMRKCAGQPILLECNPEDATLGGGSDDLRLIGVKWFTGDLESSALYGEDSRVAEQVMMSDVSASQRTAIVQKWINGQTEGSLKSYSIGEKSGREKFRQFLSDQWSIATGDHNTATAVLGSYTAKYKILRANTTGIQARITIKNDMTLSSFAHIATGYGTLADKAVQKFDSDGIPVSPYSFFGSGASHQMTITFRIMIPF
ncbi:RHS repeat-associated core domain-containing protein [Streptomyces niveiscabiei]|uniref:RHS repeat-associated core domain-containing protein n=1 Tax=Streptomyces niveiscabiei TaxID=164115 RepID=UPI0029AA0F78|nr:RHS repeat-associated core domain-containing protein [Streptomyces niveiscabiei]MDX3387587.1 RHS repeat-associated core domain-containing protein [Streptomyces niveiscabiei]